MPGVRAITMQKIKLVIYVLLIVTFAGASIAIGSELKKNGFSITLPDGWVEIPRDLMDAHEKEISRVAPNFPVQHLDYGFQSGSSKNWFEYPIISVKIHNTGRAPESQLKKIEEYSFQESFDNYKKELSSVLSIMQTGKMLYDKQNRIIWMRLDANIANIGPISGIAGMVLTEMGFIQVTGFSLKKDYATYEAIFQSVALSVSPEPELTYKSKWSDSLPSTVTGIDWGKVMAKATGKAVAVAIIIGIISLIAALRKKKNR